VRVSRSEGWSVQVTARLALALTLCALLAAGCASAPKREAAKWSRTHVVRRGDTLWSLAERYGTSVEALVSANDIDDPARIRVGQGIRVPDRPTLRAPGSGIGGPMVGSVEAGFRPPSGRGRGQTLRWPVAGRLSSPFGRRGASMHEGIDIAAARGTPVRAAAAGRVVHSDWSISGYGNLVIVEHRGGLVTLYAHNRVNRVRVGQYVEAGQVISEVGRTGHATGPHLHFEVRRDGKPRDPLDFLP
jgi:murein DD-endopeptidase MepM/ murein hydrolase activator NlpD